MEAMRYNAFIKFYDYLAHQMSFLAKAVSDDETRPFINFIHIEQSETGGLLGVATDGRRLHLVDPLPEVVVNYFGLTPGFWEVLKCKRRVWIARVDDSGTEKWTYPNWRKIMPSGEPKYTTEFMGFSLSNKMKENTLQLVKLLRDFPEATAIKLKYLMDLETSYKWELQWYGPNEALKLTEGDRTAVIKPLRFN